MLFGEYLVLNGANCMAFPLKFGQTLQINESERLIWESFSMGERWFHCVMNNDFSIIETTNVEVAETLQNLLKTIKSEKPNLNFKCHFKAEANFVLQWGLGSSSTLISLLSQWSGVHFKTLLDVSFGGSGYDVACATAKKSIIYANGQVLKEVEIPKSITDYMLFVYLGNKQNSREEIKRFKKSEVKQVHIDQMNKLIENALNTNDIGVFEQQLDKSEELISSIIASIKLKDRFFAKYLYSIKSLGAWGGDFFLATHRDVEEAKTYFKSMGYDTMFTYDELIK